MKYLPLVWAGLWRRPVRTMLTFLSAATAFLLFGTLYGVSAGFDAAIEQVNAHRLRVGSADGFRAMPIEYRAQIARLPHVASTMIVTQIGGYYQEPKSLLTVAAVGGDVDLAVFGEIQNPQPLALALRANRTGVVVGRVLADRFGWQVGDRVPIISGTQRSDGKEAWEFDVVGIYDIPNAPESANSFIFNYDYLDEARRDGKGRTNQLYVDTAGAEFNARVAGTIDRLFENSELPTDTQNEREFQAAVANRALDVKLIVTAVGGASLFALLFLTVNTMLQSVRQRVPELAVLKTLGYSDAGVATLVVAEATLLCALAALVGLFAATLLFPMVAKAVHVPHLSMPVRVPIVGLVVAVIAALLSSALPVWHVRRLSIAQALARA